MSQSLDELFNVKSIKAALSLWRKPEKLGQHPLTTLKVVEWKRREGNYRSTKQGYGEALRAVLREEIEHLRPEGKEPLDFKELDQRSEKQKDLRPAWERYLILSKQYMQRKGREFIKDNWAISQGTYNNRQKEVFQLLLSQLMEAERKKTAPPPLPKALFVDVPSSPKHFLGRDTLLTDLSKSLIRGEKVALEGMPGVGKTSLAVALANNQRIQEHFSDGILWGTLGQESNVRRVLVQWAKALGCDINALKQEAELRRVVKKAIRERRFLLVIDDVWEAESAKLLEVGGPYCSHLCTTRDQQVARLCGTQAVKVPVLAKKAAFTLLERLAPKVCKVDPAKAQELVGAVGYLPLALSLLGGYFAAPEHSFFPSLANTALNEMNSPARRIQLASRWLGQFMVPEVTLQEVIEFSLDNLPPEAVAAFYALGAFAPTPADFGREAAKAVAKVHGSMLDLLVARNLVTQSNKEMRLTLHQTLADVAQTKLKTESLKRHHDYYLTLAQRNTAKKAEAWNNLEEELPNLLLAAERMAQEKNLMGMIALEEALIHQGQLLYVRAYYQEAILLLSLSWSVQKIELIPQYQPRTLNKLGFFNSRLNQHTTAKEYLDLAQGLALQLGDQEQQADNLKYFGHIFYIRGELEQARQSYQKELTLRQARPSLLDLANCYNSLGAVEVAAGSYAEARHYFEQAIHLLHKKNNAYYLAMSCCNRGLLSLYMGDYPLAMKDFETALKQSERVSDRYTMARSLLNKGVLHSYLGEYSQALQCLTDSLPLWRQIKRLSGEVLTLGTLAEVYSALGDCQQAITYLQEAADKISEIENKEIKVDHDNKWGVVYLELGNHEEALKAYLKAADVVEGTTLRYYALVQNKLGLSRTYLAKGSQKDLAEARDYATQAITLSQEMQLAGNEPLAHAYLGKANLLLDDKETALQNCREAMRLLQKQESVHGSEAELYLHASHILAANGQPEEAQQRLERAYDLVQATAAKIEAQTLRQRYLAMPVNREISAAWQRLDRKG